MGKTNLRKPNYIKERKVVKTLLAWYDRHGRDLPWRYKSKQAPDPYRVWLSEIMLQQTTVAAVKPYFASFTTRWPNVKALAVAKDTDVMQAWAGLGYYARARNLLACARIIASEYKGDFPKDIVTLRRMPGIGAYTAAAIAAITAHTKVAPIDANIARVLARIYAHRAPLASTRAKIQTIGDTLFQAAPVNRPGDLAQAMMDLGATICTARVPDCQQCPVQKYCKAYATGQVAAIPVMPKKSSKPERHGHVYWITNQSRKQVILHRRPSRGMLGGMIGLPTSSWVVAPDTPVAPAFIPLAKAKALSPLVRHDFTHFRLHLTPVRASVTKSSSLPEGYYWSDVDTIASLGMPTLFKKALKHFLKKPS